MKVHHRNPDPGKRRCRGYRTGEAGARETGESENGICEFASNPEVEGAIKDEGGAFQMTLNFSVKEQVISLRRLKSLNKHRN